MKKLKEEGECVEQPGRNAKLLVGSDRTNWTEYGELLWNTMEIKEVFLEELKK